MSRTFSGSTHHNRLVTCSRNVDARVSTILMMNQEILSQIWLDKWQSYHLDWDSASHWRVFFRSSCQKRKWLWPENWQVVGVALNYTWILHLWGKRARRRKDRKKKGYIILFLILFHNKFLKGLCTFTDKSFNRQSTSFQQMGQKQISSL